MNGTDGQAVSRTPRAQAGALILPMNLHSRRFGGGLIQCLTPPTRTRSSKSTCTYPRLSGSGQGTAEQASVNTHRAGGNPTLSAAGAPPLTSVEGARPAQRVRYGQAGIAAQQDDVAIAERMALACHRALNATRSLGFCVRRRCLRQYEVWPAHSFIRLTVKSKDPPSSSHTLRGAAPVHRQPNVHNQMAAGRVRLETDIWTDTGGLRAVS